MAPPMKNPGRVRPAKAGRDLALLGRETLPALTGVREAAAFWVLAYHFGGDIFLLFPPARALGPLVNGGYLGVDLFFQLSGFILAYNYLDRFRSFSSGAWLTFMKKRFARIYPVHFATLHIAALMSLIAGVTGLHLVSGAPSQYGLGAWLQNILLVNGWWTLKPTCNDISWSISIEWFMYMAFPLLAFFVVRMKSWEWPLLAAAGCLLALLYGTIYLTAQEILVNGGGWLGGAIPCGVLGFLTGVMLFSARRFLRPSPAWGWISTATAIGLAIIPWFFDISEFMSGMLVIPLFAVLILALSFGNGPAAALLSSRTFVWWGDASFSLYMTSSITHMLVTGLLPWKWLAQAGLPVRLACILFIGAVIAGITVATYRWIDLPWRRRLRNLPCLNSPDRGSR